ncbi:MAG: hypothetical protein M5R41_02575 [Bacteroidia bacterium]|nr:hypothetical protein [Bacteroidia bacterium]
MRTFLFRCALFALSLFLFDKLFLFVMEYSPRTEIDKRLELILEGEMNHDIVILGSSRAARSIIAGHIDTATGHSTFNLAYPGSDIEFQEFVLRTLLRFNAAPSLLVLAVDDADQLRKNEVVKFRYDRLYPLVKYDYILRELIDRGEKNEWIAKVFILHRLYYGNLDLRQKQFSRLDTMLSCGSMPVSFRDERKELRYVYASNEYDTREESPSKVAAFTRILDLCARRSIDVLICFPPSFVSHNGAFESRIRGLAAPRARYCTYDTTKFHVYRDPRNFYDAGHPTRRAAEEFSSEIADSIKALWNDAGRTGGDYATRPAPRRMSTDVTPIR